ncbi:hypothetical protein KORDIASMS9_03444 [Kordia sp. SMS9]|uniref:T9SS type B sorting domain-containing protein n=1 Tax=Kordia sp. SMS9 TaxID=2282170 RepID=UPI000E0D3B89|nr:T9SS type B sorting domain-containing protein [Kordia sp. SMS9]AXG71188.1 hypothetical protein KORDIASMS9_03444 [Kordia sp. SMS9]
MKNKVVLFLFFICNITLGFAQGEANIWYFGENAGLDFSSGSPVALTDGQLDTLEGCATISNPAGELLFYTDGITVWDRNHTIMPNGTGLEGDPSSSQSGIIVPYPNQPNLYFVFCVNDVSSNGGLYYSLVDLNLNGGNGDVIVGRKNISLLENSAEKIAAINDDDSGYWVISYAGLTGAETTYDTYHAFRITDLGININSVTSTHSACSSNDERGYLKISPDSQKIINCNQEFEHVCYHRFDNITGIVSNEIAQLDVEARAYCAEFSLSSSKVYVSSGRISSNDAYLHQFDLEASNIQNSRVEIYYEVQERAALQLAVDGKIYYARPDRTYIGVINDPEADGLACNYVNEGVNLNGRQCKQGLPPFIQSFFNVGIQVSETCFGDATIFSVSATENITAIMWDFGDGTTSTEVNPAHIYTNPGTYTINVTVNSATQSASFTQDITIYENPIQLPVTDFIICDDEGNDDIELFDLSTKNPELLSGQPTTSMFDVSYYETLNDAMNDTNPLDTNYTSTNSTQTIFARVYNIENPNCYVISDFDLIIPEAPTTITIASLDICDILNDGEELINLSQFDAQVLDSQSNSTFNIYYYETQENATNDTNRIAPNYMLQNTNQTLHIRKENSQYPNCFVVTSFELNMFTQFIANPVENLITCDDVSNDGFEIFDVATQDEFVLNGQTGSFTISYYTSQEDADMDLNPIPQQYTNEANPQEIFVRIQNADAANCYDTTSFFIEVKETPNVDTEPMIAIVCTNESIVITADSGYDEYLWSTGETSESIVVTQAGTYTVTVTNNYLSSPAISCSNIQTFQVIESDEAIIESVEIQDWTLNNNQIEIIASGIGDYEYAIDGSGYQDSPIFTNLAPGSLTVYVRDKNGCGVVSEDINLLFYPNFFTPNNDGFNDYWQIISSTAEADLRIYIFDRYGKLLKIVKPESPGWDGLYNGRPMPSSDYWFLVERPSNNRTYTGHFTLKR